MIGKCACGDGEESGDHQRKSIFKAGTGPRQSSVQWHKEKILGDFNAKIAKELTYSYI